MIRNERVWLEVGHAAAALNPLVEFVQTDSCGAVDIFLGTVRNTNEGRAVRGLRYEGYAAMCEKLLREIAAQTFRAWPVERIAVYHRLGHLALSETAVIIAVSSPHRAEAFGACRALIDEIKHSLPIWKKEEYVEGDSAWVRCNHPHHSAAGR